jgi:hypothetical protein
MKLDGGQVSRIVIYIQKRATENSQRPTSDETLKTTCPTKN